MEDIEADEEVESRAVAIIVVVVVHHEWVAANAAQHQLTPDVPTGKQLKKRVLSDEAVNNTKEALLKSIAKRPLPGCRLGLLLGP